MKKAELVAGGIFHDAPVQPRLLKVARRSCRASEFLDPGRHELEMLEIRHVEVEMDPVLCLLRFGDALKHQREYTGRGSLQYHVLCRLRDPVVLAHAEERRPERCQQIWIIAVDRYPTDLGDWLRSTFATHVARLRRCAAEVQSSVVHRVVDRSPGDYALSRGALGG